MRRIVEAKSKSQEKVAGERPEDSSRRREYRWRKKTWKSRSRESGPKYKKVVTRRQYCVCVNFLFPNWGRKDISHLIFDEDGSEAVEELKGCDYVALDEDRGHHGCNGPPTRADGHLIEPLFKRKLPYLPPSTG